MNHLLKRPRSGYLPVYLNVEDVRDPEVFCSTLISAVLEHSSLRTIVSGMKGLQEKFVDFFSKRIRNIKTDVLEIELRDLVRDSWGAVTRKLILEMEKSTETVLFIIDEFPQLIDNVARAHQDDAARSFLQWFRSLRMKQKDELRRYRFVLGGSTSIDLSLRRLDVPDKPNHFFRLPIEPLHPQH